MTRVELRIKNGMADFNPGNKRIARYILDSPVDILKQTIADFALACGTSQATVVRFCKQLGFDGYKGLKTAITQDLTLSRPQPPEDGSYSDIGASDSPKDIIGKVAAKHMRAISETAEILNPSALAEAAALIGGAGRVDVVGFGASGLVALDLQQKLTRIGKMCLAYQDAHMQLTAAESLTETDAAVFISYSGETKDVINCLRSARRRGVKTVAITKHGASRLGRMADVVLNVCSPEIVMRSGAMSSRIAQLAIVDMLFVAVAGLAYESAQELLQRTHESLQSKHYN